MFIALACWISYRGMETTKGVQYVLVGVPAAGAGLVRRVRLHATWPTAPRLTPRPSHPDWFNPFAVDSFSAFAAGVSLSIFIYWGWDVTLTMNEETRNPEKTPGGRRP